MSNHTNVGKDEYRRYVSSIMKLLEEYPDEHKVKHRLLNLANVSMGLSTSLEDHEPTAKKLLELNKLGHG